MSAPARREQIVEVIKIRPALDALLTRLEAIRPGKDCLCVFPTRDGNPYTDRGFKTLWQRIVTKAIEDKVITAEDRFTFHDLRASYATQHKAATGELPDLHKNPETTAREYDRNKVIKRSSI